MLDNYMWLFSRGAVKCTAVAFVQDFDSYCPIHQVDLQLASVRDVGRCKLQLQTPQVQFKWVVSCRTSLRISITVSVVKIMEAVPVPLLLSDDSVSYWLSISVSTAVFLVNLAQLVPSRVSSCTCCTREMCFTSQMCFLSPSQQCRSTEGSTEQWSSLILSLSTTGLLGKGHCCLYSSWPVISFTVAATVSADLLFCFVHFIHCVWWFIFW